MDGVHDMGGQQCHGAINADADEPLFHHDWEKRVLGLSLACGATGTWNLDQSRFARESLAPAYYLSAGYYRIWLAGLEKLLLQHELVTADELADYEMRAPAVPLKRVIQAEQVAPMLAAGAPVEREANTEPRFKEGDTVVVRNHRPATHTRLPGYIRGHTGEVVMVHGCHVYPDTHALSQGESPHWLYAIEFSSAGLWGDPSNTGTVVVDCWEPYLQHAKNGQVAEV